MMGVYQDLIGYSALEDNLKLHREFYLVNTLTCEAYVKLSSGEGSKGWLIC
tara:strand:+ start:176 stop:328 length:153 start_codon:yes stop_codon:yes gene_type:complete